jgi:hypothetical protein
MFFARTKGRKMCKWTSGCGGQNVMDCNSCKAQLCGQCKKVWANGKESKGTNCGACGKYYGSSGNKTYKP